MELKLPDFCVGFPENSQDMDFVEKGKVFCTEALSACYIWWRLTPGINNFSKIKIERSGCDVLNLEVIRKFCSKQDRCMEREPNSVMLRHNLRKCCCIGNMCNKKQNIVQTYSANGSWRPTALKPSKLPTSQVITAVYNTSSTEEG